MPRRSLGTALMWALLMPSPTFGDVWADEATYMGGTIKGIPRGTRGVLNLIGEQHLVFAYGKPATLKVPYATIQTMEFGRKAGRRVGSSIALGAALGVGALPMLFSKKKQYLTIGFFNAQGENEVIILEMVEGIGAAAVSVLEAKTGKKVEIEAGMANAPDSSTQGAVAEGNREIALIATYGRPSKQLGGSLADSIAQLIPFARPLGIDDLQGAMLDFQRVHLPAMFAKSVSSIARVTKVPDGQLVRHPNGGGAAGIDYLATARATGHNWVVKIVSFSHVTSVKAEDFYDLLPRMDVTAEIYRVSDGQRIWKASGKGEASRFEAQTRSGCTPVPDHTAQGGLFPQSYFEGCAQAAVDSLVSQLIRAMSRQRISW